MGQFTQPDSLVPEPTNPIAWNRYAYVYNSPVNHTDSTGHFIDALWDIADLAADARDCFGNNQAIWCYMLPLSVAGVLLQGEGAGDNAGRALARRTEPTWLRFDPEYGHRWSDGGMMYGRLSEDQVVKLKGLASKYDRNIVVVGGWAETEIGVDNRLRALEKYGEGVDAPEFGVPHWRNTGSPTSGLNIPGTDPDFDYWTRLGGRDLPLELKQEIAPLFGIDSAEVGKYMDNYNNPLYSHPRTIPPRGSLTFHARTGEVTRRLATWQRVHP